MTVDELEREKESVPAVDQTEHLAEEPVSKNQLKKRRRLERIEAKRVDQKEHRKLKRKQRAELRREKIAQGSLNVTLSEIMDVGILTEAEILASRRKRVEQEPASMDIVVDLTFDELMTEREMRSMLCQVNRCHSANKATPKPVRFYAFGPADGPMKQQMNTKMKDYVNWKNFSYKSEPLLDVYSDLTEVYYLTADAESVLEEVSDKGVYIIGGIVDRNRYKRLCFNKAKEIGIKTVRLPIDEYITLQARKILTVNQVFEILLKFRELRNWKDAFYAVIPDRKLQLRLKGQGDVDEKEEEGSIDKDGDHRDTDMA